MRRSLLTIALLIVCWVALARPPATQDKPWDGLRRRTITLTNHIPPLPAQLAGKLTTNTLTVGVIRAAQPVQPPTGVRRYTFTTSTPIAGMTISNCVQATTNLQRGPWTNLLWITATGQPVEVDLKVDPNLPGKYLRMGTNAWGR